MMMSNAARSINATANAIVRIGNTYNTNNTTNIPSSHSCLASLCSSNPRHDKQRIEKSKGSLLQSSYRWIFENDEFLHWRHDEHSRLLWIKGDPGKGKTMLLCGLINELEARRGKNGELVSYFFCQGNDYRTNSTVSVLRGLIFLLVEQETSLLTHVQNKYDNEGEEVFVNENAYWALSEVLNNILRDPNLAKTFLIIDALDECITDLPQLLDFVANTSRLFHRVKWIFSSRNQPEIRERLELVEKRVRLSLELNDRFISAAVETYIRHKVEGLRRMKGYDDSTNAAVQHHLLSNADNTFLWVSLACQGLEKTPKWKTIVKLKTYPHGLESLYTEMMDQIQRMGDKEDISLCMDILACVATVLRPITLEELSALVGKVEHVKDLESLAQIVALCASFLVIRDDTIYFVHQSAKEFLLQKCPNRLRMIHGSIVSASLDAMNKTLRRDIYNIGDPQINIKNINPPYPDPLSAVHYSCVYWIAHLVYGFRSKDPIVVELSGANCKIHQFLKKKYMFWLEALCLLGELTYPKDIMYNLSQVLSKAPSEREYGGDMANDLAVLFQDASRLANMFEREIREFPLQTYFSVLTFGSQNNELWKAVEKHRSDRITLTSTDKIEESVISLVFSPDGQYLASALSNCTIKVWDTAKGQCLATLGHEPSNTVGPPIVCMVFSSDGQRLAVGWNDEIKIWDWNLGHCQMTLAALTDSGAWPICPLALLAFSPNMQALASCSAYSLGTFRIVVWCLTRCQTYRWCTTTMTKITSMVFSPSAHFLLLGDRSKIEIWAVATAQCIRSIDDAARHIGLRNQSVYNCNTIAEMSSMTFSEDCRHIMLEGRFGTEIWHIATGQCAKVIEKAGRQGDLVNYVAADRSSTSGSSPSTTAYMSDELPLPQSLYSRTTSKRKWVPSSHNFFNASDSSDYSMLATRRPSSESVPSHVDFSFETTPEGDSSYNGWGISPYPRIDGRDATRQESRHATDPLQYRPDITSDANWITFEGLNVILVPPKYRLVGVFAFSATSVAVAAYNSETLIIRFSPARSF